MDSKIDNENDIDLNNIDIISSVNSNKAKLFIEPTIPKRNVILKKQAINNKRKPKSDVVELSDSDNDSSSDMASESGSQSNQVRITKLQNRIVILEANNKTQSKTINDLKAIIESFDKKIIHLDDKLNLIENKNNNINNNNTQPISNKPLFSDLFKSKESENMSFEIKNIYNIQQDLLERDKKKNNIIIYGLPIDKFENNDIDFDSDNLKIDKMLTKVSVDLSKIVKLKRLINKSGVITNPPILIEFKEYNEKINLLKKSSEIRKFIEYEKIYINEDLTTAQRIINKDLIQLRNNLNTQHNTKDLNVNYYYTIRNFKVVKKLKSL